MYSFIRRPCFSALQRAENSSKLIRWSEISDRLRFSALQRAENSSNHIASFLCYVHISGFSALQRAENSSNDDERPIAALEVKVSVLFSEPKIPQISLNATDC